MIYWTIPFLRLILEARLLSSWSLRSASLFVCVSPVGQPLLAALASWGQGPRGGSWSASRARACEVHGGQRQLTEVTLYQLDMLDLMQVTPHRCYVGVACTHKVSPGLVAFCWPVRPTWINIKKINLVIYFHLYKTLATCMAMRAHLFNPTEPGSFLI